MTQTPDDEDSTSSEEDDNSVAEEEEAPSSEELEKAAEEGLRALGMNQVDDVEVHLGVDPSTPPPPPPPPPADGSDLVQIAGDSSENDGLGDEAAMMAGGTTPRLDPPPLPTAPPQDDGDSARENLREIDRLVKGLEEGTKDFIPAPANESTMPGFIPAPDEPPSAPTPTGAADDRDAIGMIINSLSPVKEPPPPPRASATHPHRTESMSSISPATRRRTTA